MRNRLLTILSLTVLMAAPLQARVDDHIEEKDLPKTALELLSDYFEEDVIVALEFNKEKEEYEVRTNTGKKLIFDKYGEWILIDCNQDRFPMLLIPRHIRTELNKKFGPYIYAIQVTKYGGKFLVELNNKLQVKF